MNGSKWASYVSKLGWASLCIFSFFNKNSSLPMVMLWCLHVLRILCDIMKTWLWNMQIPIPVLENKEVGQIEGLAAFHAASKGCIKQDVECCKGHRSQTVCHPCQAPRNLRVDTLSILSWQTVSDAAWEGRCTIRQEKKIGLSAIWEYIWIRKWDDSQMKPLFSNKVAKSNWEGTGEKLHPQKKQAFCFGWFC